MPSATTDDGIRLHYEATACTELIRGSFGRHFRLFLLSVGGVLDSGLSLRKLARIRSVQAVDYEESGSGTPLIFVHEFAGDHCSYEAQLRHFGRRHHAIAFNARGYPPSDVPDAVSAYSQPRAADDILAILDHIGAARAHVAGISMGAFATLHFGLRHPHRALSLCLGGCGYGAEPDRQDLFRSEAAATAAILRREGMAAFAERYAYGPTRVQFETKDPRGHAEFKRMLAEHSATGSANTQAGVQKGRPSLYDLQDALAQITVPTLIVSGDEDWPCLAPSLMLKRVIPSAALAILPNTGHALSVEEPDAYNRLLGEFLAQVESGRWPMRDPRAVSTTITGIRG